MIVNQQSNIAAFAGNHKYWWPGIVSTRIVKFVAATEGLTLRLLLGTTQLLTTGVLVPSTGLTNKEWKFDSLFTVRSIGASGSVQANGDFDNGTQKGLLSPTAVTVDTKVSQEVHVSAKHGVAAASNTISVQELLVEKM